MLISLSDTSNITQIEIIKENSKLLFIKKDGKWILNEVFHVNEHSIKRLLRIFKNIEINSLIAKSEHDSVTNTLKKNGFFLHFVNSDKIDFNFWIGDFNQSINATILMTSDNLPVYASAPGLSNDLNQFIDIDPLFWRNKQLFEFKAENIKEINFINSFDPDISFSIKNTNSGYKVFDIRNKQFNSEKDKVLRYLSYFNNMEFESVEKGLSSSETDSIIHAQPKFIIKVLSQSGPEFELKLIAIKVQNTENQFDLNKVYGIFNSQKPILIINYFSIDPIIKEIHYFK